MRTSVPAWGHPHVLASLHQRAAKASVGVGWYWHTLSRRCHLHGEFSQVEGGRVRPLPQITSPGAVFDGFATNPTDSGG